MLTANEWARAAERLILRDDLPLTLQGGEPTLYRGFYEFVNNIKNNIKLDLLTNMQFDEREFAEKTPLKLFLRDAPYAPIRVSYHPAQNDIAEIIKKTEYLQARGFRIGIYAVLPPDAKKAEEILLLQKELVAAGFDFRIKEFLGEYNGKIYGQFKYQDAVSNKPLKNCECRTTELLVAPNGLIYSCHSHLYAARYEIGHILDENFTADAIDIFRECNYYGDCNPCDVKIKTNRFQIFGHTSVEIRNIKEK